MEIEKIQKEALDTLVNFMNARRFNNEKHEKQTHRSWGPTLQGNFYIDKAEIKNFTKLYKDVILSGLSLNILEVQPEVSPILIDIDLKSNDMTSDRLYDDNLISSVITNYDISINHFLNVDHIDYKYYLFEKSKASNGDNVVKDGFHIVVKDIYTTSEIRHLIRDYAVKLCEEEGTFKDYLEDTKTIIDKSVVSSNGWFLYGSHKPGGQPYTLTKTFNKNLDVYTFVENALQVNKLISKFSIHSNYKTYSEENAITIKATNRKESTEKKKETPQVNTNNNTNNNDELKLVLNSLNSKRFTDFETWRNLYFIFKNEGYDLDLFDEYCKTIQGYDKENNYRILKNVKAMPEGFKAYRKATLYNWLKEDDLEVFKSLCVKTKIYELAANLTQNQVAKYYCEYIQPFKYIRSETTGWYEYNKYNILEKSYKDKPPCSLLNDIADKFQELFIEERNKLRPPFRDTENYDTENKKYIQNMKMFDNAYKQLGNSKFIEGCIKFLGELYTIKDIDDKLDSEQKIIAFNDGNLYDIRTGKFRKIEPNDYISKTTRRPMPKNINKEKLEEVKTLLYSVFEDNEIVNYWLKVFSCSIFSNKYESFYILTGKGRNGKGLLMNLISYVLGDYFYEGEQTFLTSITKKGAPDYTSANCKGVRILSISEPDDGSDKSNLNTNFIKKITGGDQIEGRRLYEGIIKYCPFFNLFLQCNDIPNIKKIDNAMMLRLKIIRYRFQFVPNPNNPDERQVDTTLKEKFKTDEEFKDAFLHLLLETAKASIDDKVIEQPKDIVEETNNYIEDNNPTKLILNEYFTVTNNTKDKILCSDFVKKFNFYSDEKLSPELIHKGMKFNGFDKFKITGIYYYKGIKEKEHDLDKSNFIEDNDLDK